MICRAVCKKTADGSYRCHNKAMIGGLCVQHFSVWLRTGSLLVVEKKKEEKELEGVELHPTA